MKKLLFFNFSILCAAMLLTSNTITGSALRRTAARLGRHTATGLKKRAPQNTAILKPYCREVCYQSCEPSSTPSPTEKQQVKEEAKRLREELTEANRQFHEALRNKWKNPTEQTKLAEETTEKELNRVSDKLFATYDTLKQQVKEEEEEEEEYDRADSEQDTTLKRLTETLEEMIQDAEQQATRVKTLQEKLARVKPREKLIKAENSETKPQAQAPETEQPILSETDSAETQAAETESAPKIEREND